MKKLILSVFVVLSFLQITLAQSDRNDFFPRTPEAVVYGYYHELSQSPEDVSRATHASSVFTKYFSKDYVEWAGTGTQKQTFEPFKGFVEKVFTDLPNLQVFVEEIFASGDKVAVKIKLEDKASNVLINYVSLYHVEGNKITRRYAYSDGAF